MSRSPPPPRYRASYQDPSFWESSAPRPVAMPAVREREFEEKEPQYKSWQCFLDIIREKEIQKLLFAIWGGVILVFIIEGIVRVICTAIKHSSS